MSQASRNRSIERRAVAEYGGGLRLQQRKLCEEIEAEIGETRRLVAKAERLTAIAVAQATGIRPLRDRLIDLHNEFQRLHWATVHPQNYCDRT